MKDVVRKSKDAKDECKRILDKFQIQEHQQLVFKTILCLELKACFFSNVISRDLRIYAAERKKEIDRISFFVTQRKIKVSQLNLKVT